MKIRFIYLFVLIVFFSCKSGNTLDYDLREINSIDFSDIKNYNVSDRNSSIYYVVYDNKLYQAFMPLDSDTLISLKYLEKEYDSLGNWNRNNVININSDSSMIEAVNKICLKFRAVWQIDSKNIYLISISVANDDVMLRILWKKSNERLKVLITKDSIKTAIRNIDSFNMSYSFVYEDKFEELPYYQEYRNINNNLYIRPCGKDDANNLY